jgi:hypothetical protein
MATVLSVFLLSASAKNTWYSTIPECLFTGVNAQYNCHC